MNQHMLVHIFWDIFNFVGIAMHAGMAHGLHPIIDSACIRLHEHTTLMLLYLATAKQQQQQHVTLRAFPDAA